MTQSIRDAFEAKAGAWEAYTQTPAGRLREQLNWHYLRPHLPPARRAPRILDAGGGTGGLAIRLAQQGYQVHLLDLAEEMLHLAREKARAAHVADQITCHCAGVENVADLFDPQSLDGVICHTLLEYVADPAYCVQLLAQVLRKDGVFSLVFVNRYADSLRLALAKGDLEAARTALTASTSPADLFGVPRRTFDAASVRQMMVQAGVQPIAEYGVRIFADYLTQVPWQEDPATFESLVALETAAAMRFPYQHIGRYGQMIGRRTT